MPGLFGNFVFPCPGVVFREKVGYGMEDGRPPVGPPVLFALLQPWLPRIDQVGKGVLQSGAADPQEYWAGAPRGPQGTSPSCSQVSDQGQGHMPITPDILLGDTLQVLPQPQAPGHPAPWQVEPTITLFTRIKQSCTQSLSSNPGNTEAGVSRKVSCLC